MLALSLDPLQGALPQEDLLRVVEHTLVTVVNQVCLKCCMTATRVLVCHMPRICQQQQEGVAPKLRVTPGVQAFCLQ